MVCTIELEIDAASCPGDFTTRVVNSPAGGEPSAIVRLDVDGLLRDRGALETMVLASAVSGRRVISLHEQELRRVGRLLFDALFSGSVLGTYRASVATARQRGEPLRVVLRLTDPKLAALPWEAMFDQETGAYICRRGPLVRHIPAPYTPPPLNVTPPLRVLGLVASPRGMPLLDVSAEQANLTRALSTPIAEGLIELDWVIDASWESVHEKLLSGQWHVLHFIGHGDYDLKTDQGLIALVGQGGRADLVEAEQLADLLHEARPTPRLVVLNSCSSGQQGTHDLFSGTAAALVRTGISAVAAMQFTVSDPAAIAFAKGFYSSIAHGRTVDEATGSGRIEIVGTGRGTLEWVTPVLHVRGDATQLFDLMHRPVPATSPPNEPSESRVDLTTDRQWVHAVRAYRAEQWTEAVDRFEVLRTRYPGESSVLSYLWQARRARDIDSWSSKADAAESRGDWDAAITALQNLAALDSSHPDLDFRLERVRMAQRRGTPTDDRPPMESDPTAAMERLDPDPTDPNGQAVHYEPRGLGGLVVDRVQYKINGEQVLDNISLVGRPGTLTAVIGPSGAGKTTLSKLIFGAISPTKGTVLFAGHNIHTAYASLRGRVGMVPQDDALHRKLTVNQELGYAAELRLPPDTSEEDRRLVIRLVLEELDMTQQADIRLDRLSTTQRKRASLALELLTGPSLLILDEPTLGQGPALDRQVMTMLRQLADAGRVVLVVTTTLTYLDVCDQVLLLAPGGKTAFYGLPSQISTAMGTTNWADIFSAIASEPERAHARYLLNTVPPAPNPQTETPTDLGQPHKSSRWRRHFLAIARRQVRLIVSDRGYFFFLALLPFLIGALSALAAGRAGGGNPDVAGVAPQPPWILVLLIIGAVFIGVALTTRDFVDDLAMFPREHGAGLSTSAYLLAKVAVFSVVGIIGSAIMTTIALTGLNLLTNGVVDLFGASVELFGAVAASCVASALLGVLLFSGLVWLRIRIRRQ